MRTELLINTLILSGVILFAIGIQPDVFAHKLLSAYPDNRTFDTALTIPNIESESWFTLEESNGDSFHYYQINLQRNQEVKLIQVLVPVLDEQPLNVYELNVISTNTILKATIIEDPEIFHEEFSDTEWYIIYDEVFVAPETDTYTFIVSNTSGESGKFAFGIGSEENFELDDFIYVLPNSVFQMKWFFEDYNFFLIIAFVIILITVGMIALNKKK